METNEKVFLSQQLICMLPPLALKVMGYLLNWQKYDSIKYFPNQMCGFMHITEKELELAIQTLEDNNLISIGKIDQTYMITINKETVRKYFNVDMRIIHDHQGIKMSETVKWNIGEDKAPQNASIESMSDDDLKKLLMRIEASLSERQQVKELVKTSSTKDDLPW